MRAESKSREGRGLRKGHKRSQGGEKKEKAETETGEGQGPRESQERSKGQEGARKEL